MCGNYLITPLTLWVPHLQKNWNISLENDLFSHTRCEFGDGKKERERNEEKPTQLAKDC
jgi:hypothetical protein